MLKHHIIMFIVNILVGITLNPMNLLAYRLSDLYLSYTLFYGGIAMAANMIWSHEIISYLTSGKFNITQFLIGIVMIISITYVLRKQLCVDGQHWLRRMIGHHSTAITTSNRLLNNKKAMKNNPALYRLTKDIVFNQEKEIAQMKNMLTRRIR